VHCAALLCLAVRGKGRYAASSAFSRERLARRCMAVQLLCAAQQCRHLRGWAILCFGMDCDAVLRAYASERSAKRREVFRSNAAFLGLAVLTWAQLCGVRL
jgi:hypothetical protein